MNETHETLKTKEPYETPKMEIIEFEAEDVIQASGAEGPE